MPLEEPSHLSPVTVAKLIVLKVDMVGMWIELQPVGSQLFSGSDFPSAVIDWALGKLDAAWLNVPEEVNFRVHFQMLMRHPVIEAGVRIAAWRHYRLPEDLLSI